MSYRAHVCAKYGRYQDLRIERLPEQKPNTSELLVRNRAFAIGFPDLLTIQGKYQRKPALPFVPGSEFCGEVIDVGDSVEDFKIGDPVMGSVLIGAYAEQILAPENACMKLPSGFDFAVGASFQVAYKTAYVGLVERGHIRPGESLLVLGAAGGVGLAAVELGKALGATVIAAASSDEKLVIACSHGADNIINYSDGDFRDAVKGVTDGRGVDLVFDPVGGDCFDEAVRCIAPFGRLLVIGFASGRIPEIALNYPLIKQISIVGVRAGEFGRVDPVGGRRVKQALQRLANSGKLHPYVHLRAQFDAVESVFDSMIAREIHGRAVAVIE